MDDEQERRLRVLLFDATSTGRIGGLRPPPTKPALQRTNNVEA
jgi:hypothetical protein